MEKRGLQDVLSDQTKSLAKKMMKDNDSQTERLEERIADVGITAHISRQRCQRRECKNFQLRGIFSH